MKMQQINKAGAVSPAGMIIAALCIVIYLFAMVQAGVRLYLSVDERRSTAELEFEYIANLTASAGKQNFMDDRFIETITYALSTSRSIEALIISGGDGEYAFERQKGRAVTWVNNSPRFINKFGFSSQNHYKPLSIPNVRNASIKAIASAYDYAEFSQILKQTLFLVLVSFALAFFTMLMQLLTGKSTSKTSAVQASSLNTSNTSAENSSAPNGLYSQRSNIGWEEYTKDRLDSELHRCASTEKDLTLFVIEFVERLNNSQFKQASEEAVSLFTSRDLLFEKGHQGITAICPGVDLETGLAKAQVFHQKISEKIFFNRVAEPCLFIGLSSRAGRLLNAGRMTMEADEALKKAKRGRNAIIAFKSNLEKYREFVRKQG
jgi:hypothetical protein